MAEYEYEQRQKRIQKIIDSNHDYVRENTRVLTPFEQRTVQVDWHSHHRDLVTNAFVKRNICHAIRQKQVIESTREMQHARRLRDQIFYASIRDMMVHRGSHLRQAWTIKIMLMLRVAKMAHRLQEEREKKDMFKVMNA